MKIPNKKELQQVPSNHSSDIGFKDFMKLYKDYAKKPCSFLVCLVCLCHPIIHCDLGITYYKTEY